MFDYKPPKMSDVYSSEKKKLFTVVSTFAGCGGSSTGYRMAGGNILAANEFMETARKIYSKNYPHTFLFPEDIRKLTGEQVLSKIGLKKGELDILDGSPPCFAAGTFITTSTGLKKIEDVVAGDLVLTHTNTFKKVLGVMKRKSEKIFKLNFSGGLEFKATKEHPFLIRKRSHKKTKILAAPDWLPVSDIAAGDYVGSSINQEAEFPDWSGIENNINQSDKKNHVNVLSDLFKNKNFWWVIGRFIGDGWVRLQETPKKTRYGFIICCSKVDDSELIEIKSRLDGLFHYRVSEQRTTYRITVNNKELVKYAVRFGRGAKNKQLTSDILNLPVDYLKECLSGYLSADGSYEGDDKWSCSSISKILMYEVRAAVAKVYHSHCCMGFRKREGVPHIIEGRTINQNNSYSVRFTTAPQETISFYEDGIIWSVVKGKEEIVHDDFVYNFEVDEDNSYTADGFIAHNCAAFSSSGLKEKAWGKEKKYSSTTQRVDDLFYEFARLLEEIQPKVFIAENVKGLAVGEAKHILGGKSKSLKNFFDFDEQTLLNGMSGTISETLRNCGYKVSYKVFDASEYGVPQKRERLIFMGIRNDLGVLPSFPSPTTKDKKIIGKEALYDLMFNGAEAYLKPTTKHYWWLKNHFPPHTTRAEIAKIKRDNNFKVFEQVYNRNNWNKHCLTVLQSDFGNVFHPVVDRYLAVDEARRMQTFPDDYNILTPKKNRVFVSLEDLENPKKLQAFGEYANFDCAENSGNIKNLCAIAGLDYSELYTEKIFALDFKTEEKTSPVKPSGAYEFFGRAVPPLFMKAIASHVRDHILPNIARD